MTSSLKNMFTLKALKPRNTVQTSETPKIKDGLRKIEDLKVSLQKLQKLLLALQEKGVVHHREESAVGAHLGQFMDRDRVLAVPSQNPEESGFLLAMQKFSEIFADASILESSFCEETQKAAGHIQEFIDSYLTENTKTLRKVYENARSDYDKMLQKIAGLKDNKKLSVVKIYEAEKERSKLQKVLDKATRGLEDHCDDLDDMFNIHVAGYLVDWANALKNSLGLSYGLFDDVRDYLAAVKHWCNEEERVWTEHKGEREATRADLKVEESVFVAQQFASMFTLDVIHLVSSVGSVDSPTMISSFCCLYHQAGLPLPEGLEKFPGANLDPNAKSPIDIQHFVKDNFDAIGSKLIEENKREFLVSLGESLANLEKSAV